MPIVNVMGDLNSTILGLSKETFVLFLVLATFSIFYPLHKDLFVLLQNPGVTIISQDSLNRLVLVTLLGLTSWLIYQDKPSLGVVAKIAY